MKVFISWSGKLSNKIAKILYEWLPSIINTLDIFYSPDDIRKGENWDLRLSRELGECDFGIICLTKENLTSPWINFEAGAIAKTVNSRMTALLIDIKPSDIKGPITRFQATRIDKEDFYKLVYDLNECLDIPLDIKLLVRNFNLVWDVIKQEMDSAVEENKAQFDKPKDIEDTVQDSTIQEILQIVRNISTYNSINKSYDRYIRRAMENEELQKKIDVLTLSAILSEGDPESIIKQKITISYNSEKGRDIRYSLREKIRPITRNGKVLEGDGELIIFGINNATYAAQLIQDIIDHDCELKESIKNIEISECKW